MSAYLNDNDPRFVDYYTKSSDTAAARARAQGILRAVLRLRQKLGLPTESLRVADIGCNAGTQSRCWLEAGHSVRGIDISRDLVEVARRRSEIFGSRAEFEVGSATQLPWLDGAFNVCLLPELLEHVEDWQTCIREAVRVLAPQGTLYLTTTNVLCPKQQEFNLPCYSWYPASLKRHFLRQATTTRPDLVNFASYPAYHWFSPYSLRRALSPLGVTVHDRFDLMDNQGKSLLSVLAVQFIRAIPAFRWLGHVLTPSTIIAGQKA